MKVCATCKGGRLYTQEGHCLGAKTSCQCACKSWRFCKGYSSRGSCGILLEPGEYYCERCIIEFIRARLGEEIFDYLNRTINELKSEIEDLKSKLKERANDDYR